MAWQQLTFNVAAEQAELVAETLQEAGAISIAMQDDAGEILIETQWEQPTLWSKVRLTALLPENADLAATNRFVQETLGIDKPLPYQVELVKDQDWAESWKQHYKPVHMGGNLWICPSWREPPDRNAVNVVLDPGMAFGTGDHPTTALCLEWLAQRSLQNKIILDYGCGSGILAIAALKLGAREAYAVDIDEQALAVTWENAELNGVGDRLHVTLPGALPVDLRADIVVANILARALAELAPTLIAHTKAVSELALSGLLTEQADMVQPHYMPPFNLTIYERGGWIALAGGRS